MRYVFKRGGIFPLLEIGNSTEILPQIGKFHQLRDLQHLNGILRRFPRPLSRLEFPIKFQNLLRCSKQTLSAGSSKNWNIGPAGSRAEILGSFPVVLVFSHFAAYPQICAPRECPARWKSPIVFISASIRFLMNSPKLDPKRRKGLQLT